MAHGLTLGVASRDFHKLSRRLINYQWLSIIMESTSPKLPYPTLPASSGAHQAENDQIYDTTEQKEPHTYRIIVGVEDWEGAMITQPQEESVYYLHIMITPSCMFSIMLSSRLTLSSC